MERFGDDRNPALVAQSAAYRVYQVRWPVLEGVYGEGLLLEPVRPPRQVVAVPDADQTPEQIAGLDPGLAPGAQFARRLAESGIRVVVPTIIDRTARGSAIPKSHHGLPAPRVDLSPGVSDGPPCNRLRGAKGAGRRGLVRGHLAGHPGRGRRNTGKAV